MSIINVSLSRRLRTTPFETRVFEHGVKAFTIYNKMTLPTVFESAEADYQHLCEHVQLWDVACERQVQIKGPDALALVELITPRDISKCAVNQCMYAPLVDEFGGIINDPIIVRVAENTYWLSIADSDVVLWVKGIAFGRKLNVDISEPDVSPLGVQGPKAEDLMVDILGEQVRDIGFFKCIEVNLAGANMLMARSGWSGQGGFEIYLNDSAKGLKLWDEIWAAGEKYNIRAGCPNSIERLETGLLSFGNDMTYANNPFECGLDRFFKLGKIAEYMSRQALDKIARDGVQRKMVKLKISADAQGNRAPAVRETWPITTEGGDAIGIVTSLAYSPRFDATLAFAFIDVEHIQTDATVTIVCGEKMFDAKICDDKWQ